MKWRTCEKWSRYSEPNSPPCNPPRTCFKRRFRLFKTTSSKRRWRFLIRIEFGSYKPTNEEDDVEGDSNDNSDDHSDATNDASNGANSGDGDDGGDNVDDSAFAMFDHPESD
ncbi:hypothetical protein RHMOL_Rhmol04G0177700 [Rhododendron molle]|uniref:Uncharacterized protein n=1 Tax=Rhododendron molle TaxID=49168 RepID=A0ACC0P3E3_RHOML|nr:hypothetical protein RHMOL_Rhmol04G0177700 [Rhododendron molle]